MPRARRQACYAKEASSKLQVDVPAMEGSPLSMAVTITSAGLNSNGIDGVEVALEALEDLGERPAVVARGRARQRLREVARVVVDRARRGGPAAIDDGVVGAAHRGARVGVRRRQRRRAEAVRPALQRKLELVRLVQRDLEHAGDDLGRAGEALRGREMMVRHRRTSAQSRAACVDHAGGGGRPLSITSVAVAARVAVVELLNSASPRAARVPVRTPARKMASLPSPRRDASRHIGWRGRRSRVGRAHHERPAASAASIALGERHRAEAAHADLGDASPRRCCRALRLPRRSGSRRARRGRRRS